MTRARALLAMAALLALLAACGSRGAGAPTPAAPTPAPSTTVAATAAPANVATAPAVDAPTTAAPALDAATAPPEQPAGTPTSAASTYDNPVYPNNFPDPFILRVGEIYYGYATNPKTQGLNVQVISSTDLVNWKWVGDALPRLPKWAAERKHLTWAPGVLQRGDRFILYYTARFVEGNRQCISRAVSDRPAGPYTDDSERPFICQLDLGGSIDPHPFVDEDGKLYLLWKNDGNCCGKPTRIWIQQLSDDGLDLVGEPAELIRNDLVWEGPLIENPALWKHDGKYYLFYSGSYWDTHTYAVGYAVCETIRGPCDKPQRKPILKFEGKILGPGGQSLFTDTEGNLWMAYHAWTAPYIGDQEGSRSLHIDPVSFEHGAPVVHGPTDDPRPLP